MNSNKREILFCGGCSKPIDNHDPNCPFYEELDDALPTPAPVAEPVICVKCKQIYLKEPACNCGECGGKTFEKTHQSNAQFAVSELPKEAEEGC